MTTFVLNSDTQITNEPTSMLSTKRALETDSPISVNKRAKRPVPLFKPEYYNHTKNLPNIVATKDKDGNDMVQIYNSLKNPYKVMAPPGVCKYVSLGEGGNIGTKEWCKDESSATIGFVYTTASFPMIAGESAESHHQRAKQFSELQNNFVEFLKDTEAKAMTQFFESCEVLRNMFIKKAKVVLRNDCTEEKLNDMALKLMLKAAKSPIKEENGMVQFQVKCGAYRNMQGQYVPRDVNVYDGNNIKFPHLDTMEPGDIKTGAILRPVFTMRVYSTPGYKTFGTTYQLDERYVIFHKNGSGSSGSGSAIRSEDQLKPREYTMKGHTSANGSYNVYINDLNQSKYLHRAPLMKTKYCDLENGTLGKFPNVTEKTAKYTATFIEDESSKEYFDHIETMVKDVATFLFNDKNILKDVKEELRETAKDVAEDTEGDVETTMKNLFMDNIQSPIKHVGETRELKVSQRMFQMQKGSEELVQNRLKFCDGDADPIETPSLERGCCLAPVLEPSIYTLANGTAGIKLNINLAHPIKIADQAGFLAEGEPEKVFTADMF